MGQQAEKEAGKRAMRRADGARIEEKLDQLIGLQAIKRAGTFSDVANVVDFLIRPESEFITGQVLFLGGV